MRLKYIPAAYRVTVKGLVRDNTGRLLFVRERDGVWDFPGGGLEHGEGLEEALRREFREEVQAEIEILPTAPVIIPTWHSKFDDPVLIIAFEVTLLGKPRVSEEVEELAYLHPQDIAPNQLDSTLIGKLAAPICDINQ
mgnify:CR=1 FL=1